MAPWGHGPIAIIAFLKAFACPSITSNMKSKGWSQTRQCMTRGRMSLKESIEICMCCTAVYCSVEDCNIPYSKLIPIFVKQNHISEFDIYQQYYKQWTSNARLNFLHAAVKLAQRFSLRHSSERQTQFLSAKTVVPFYPVSVSVSYRIARHHDTSIWLIHVS